MIDRIPNSHVFFFSLQQEVRQPDTSLFNTSFSSEPPIREDMELNDQERQRNQLMSIEYQRSLLRIQQCKRSHSVLVSWNETKLGFHSPEPFVVEIEGSIFLVSCLLNLDLVFKVGPITRLTATR